MKRQLKIAYIGGGSRLWARVLMSDIASTNDIEGSIDLYDIDKSAARDNKIIGNMISADGSAAAKWKYRAIDDIDEALSGADFVIISIMPGTFDEMASDVHYPEKYGIYQTVGDTTGPGGYLRAMRCVPCFRFFADRIRANCKDAWVINYTNPMSLCVRTLYEEFKEIKAFGCCHEVFGTQNLLSKALKRIHGIEVEKRNDIQIEVSGINHFTWLTSASYKGENLFPVFAEYGKLVIKDIANGVIVPPDIENAFYGQDLIKFELFERYGIIAAAGDRHLAEFMQPKWFLESPEIIRNRWMFNRTSVDYRRADLVDRIARTKSYVNGTEKISLEKSDEEAVEQITALCGLSRLVTNINMPNTGQVKGYPEGAILETSGVLTYGKVLPVNTEALPPAVNSLILRHVENQEAFIKAAFNRDARAVAAVLANDPLCSGLNFKEVKEMFTAMVKNTMPYLKEYWFADTK